mgnify:CR=1 FL=1
MIIEGDDLVDRSALRAADPWRCAMHLKALIEGEYPALLDIYAIDQPSKLARRRIADAAADAFLRAYAPDPPTQPSLGSARGRKGRSPSRDRP